MSKTRPKYIYIFNVIKIFRKEAKSKLDSHLKKYYDSGVFHKIV